MEIEVPRLECPIAVVREAAFVSIVVSALEVYKSEVLGILIGSAGRHRFIVEYAVAHQTARRGLSRVEANPVRYGRLNTNLQELTCYELIGDFHSHAGLGGSKSVSQPSLEDLEEVREGDLCMIVAVNDAWKRRDWGYVGQHDLSGTVGAYHLRLSAYTRIVGGRVCHVRIRCPYALGFRELR